MPSLLSLLVAETEAAIYARAISVATSLGLPTTAWSAVNPTRSLYWFLTKVFSALEPTVANSTATNVDVAYTLWLYTSVGQTSAAIEAAVAAALGAMFASRPIGGDIVPPATTGTLYQSLIASTIAETFPADTFRVAVTSPAGDTALAINAVAVTATSTMERNEK